MQIAADVRYHDRRIPESFKLSDMRIDFVDPNQGQKVSDHDEEEIAHKAHMAKLRWRGRIGGATVNRLTPEQEALIDSLSPEEAVRERRRLANLAQQQSQQQRSNRNGF